MAGLFESFRSSSMPKRLLRYALSQIDVLDTDTLDLDNLDLAWGMNTVLEFRDVGLRLKKLQKLIDLPPNFAIQKAKVSNLRITLPVDIYSSPIHAQIVGVDVYLKVSSKPGESKKEDESTADTQTPSPVPTAVDLAQSFLQLQSPRETQALREALAAESHEKNLGESVVLECSGELDSDDDDTASSTSQTLGTGQALNLPSFLAGFLQGIVDRAQISIEGVTFQLEVDVAVDRESPASSIDTVTFQLVLARITIEGVTTEIGISGDSTGEETAVSPEKDVPKGPPKKGKRHISLFDVSGFLVSEANVFSALARSPSLSSRSPVLPSIGVKCDSSTTSSAEGFRSPRNSVAPNNDRSDPPTGTRNYTVLGGVTESMTPASSVRPQDRDTLQDSEDAFNIPYDFDGGSDEPKSGLREKDSLTGPTTEKASSLSTPRASFYGDRPLDSPLHVFQPTVASDISWHTLDGKVHTSTPSHSTSNTPPMLHLEQQDEAGNTDTQTGVFEDSFHSSLGQPETAHVTGQTDGLTASHIFSHEEAESMYMSAFSQAGAQSTHHSIPGAWEADEYDNGHQYFQAADATQGLNINNEQEPVTPPVARIDSEKRAEVDHASAPNMEQGSAGSESAHIQHEEPEEQSDPAATPKGPTRLVKKILSLKYISVYLPSNHHTIQVSPPDQQIGDLTKSASPHLPGAFSVYSAEPPTAFRDADGSNRSDETKETNQDSDYEKSIEVNLAPMEVFFDASIGFLLTMVVSELSQAVKVGVHNRQEDIRVVQPDAQGSTNDSTVSPTNIKFHAENISILFLDKISGMVDTAERFFGVSKSSHLDQTEEALLQMSLENLVVGVSITPGPLDADGSQPRAGLATEVSIGLQRFRFGYTDNDILSFDQHAPLRASVRDAFPPAGNDISIKILQTLGSTKCEVNTLPLLISMDLQRLDETLGWFGGLSSFLSMGSSSISSVAPGKSRGDTFPQKSKRGKSPQKQRGVRFDTPIVPNDKSAAADNKVDMRIGGVHIELLGKDCSVVLDSSAVKTVSREEGIGVGVSRVRLIGPYLRNSRGEPPVAADIINTRLEFLNTPGDKDLERLLELITPSKVRFDERDDVIMVDTLLRQRRNGPLLRISIDDLNVQMHNLAQLSCLPALGEELARLGTVAKYLPEDDRPGLLTLGRLYRLNLSANIGGKIGALCAKLTDLELAHITIPSLFSIATGSLFLLRNETEELVGSSVTATDIVSSTPAKTSTNTTVMQPLPALMMRIIGNDIEPVIKLKLWGLNIEYRVPTFMDLLGLADDATPEDFEASLAASVANLGEKAHSAIVGSHSQQVGSPGDASSGKSLSNKGGSAAPRSPTAKAKPIAVDLSLHDCVIGLNPLGLVSKMNVVLADARIQATVPQDEDINAVVHFNKVALLLIDDVSTVSKERDTPFALHRPSNHVTDMATRLCLRGFVDVCQISSAKVSLHISEAHGDGQRAMEFEVRDDLLVLETCADSTQTLINLANALKPPTPPNKEAKFKTEVLPVTDLLASISIDAFGRAEGNYNFDEDFILEEEEDPEATSDEDLYGARFTKSGISSSFQSHADIEQSVASLPSVVDDDMLLGDDDLDIEGLQVTVAERLFSASSSISDKGVVPRTQTVDKDDGQSGQHASRVEPDENLATVDELDVDDGFFGTASETAAEGLSPTNRWNSTQNGYDKALGGVQMDKSPLRIRVRDVHFIWNLFDGYDWQHTRDTIAKSVEEVEAKAYERRTRHHQRSGHDHYNAYAEDEEEETVIGDFLFNSIYIGIPANHDPRDLTQAIQQNIYGDNTETESVAATTITATTARASGTGPTQRVPGYGGAKRLKLNRSRRHKITFELGGIAADVVMFPPGSGETQSSIDFRVRDLDVFDHVPTSTWKKFATYDRDAGERPIDGDMLRLEMMLVKPMPELAAVEYVLKVSVLPLRLHVDQDALDFITRFFEFKDESAVPTNTSPSDVPFIQRAEIRDIPVQLDFKPKRVDYAGLRSGHTTEFMNFLILDGSRMTLRHTIIYGVSGFDRLGDTLNDIWMPDIKRHQLPGVLAGLAPVRSLVTVGSGFKDLIEIPIQEYRHNGRIVRSISKGAVAFAKSTGTELVKLGAKVATGTQYVLQGAEGMLVQKDDELGGVVGGGTSIGGEASGRVGGADNSGDERKQISLYADQPTSVVQGLRHAYSSLARDLHIARDAIIAVPAEVRETTSATGAAKVVARHAPTIIFRPAIGATKAIGQTLMGATNSLDPQNLRRAEDKYKPGPGRI